MTANSAEKAPAAETICEAASSHDIASHDIAMPRLSRTHTAAAISAWSVREGDRVAEGDVLAEVSAGSTTMELEAPGDGIVAAILHAAGSAEIAAGTVIARLSLTASDEASRMPAPQTAAQQDRADVTALDVSESAMPVMHSANTQNLSYADALRAGLSARMRADGTVFVIGDGVSDPARCSPVLRGLSGEFGDARVVATPITPHALCGLAVGAAMAGLRPIVEMTAWSLALQAMDPIVQSAAKTRYRSNGQTHVPLVLRGRNGVWPGSGPMHTMNLAAWFASVPGLKVVCPVTPACAKGLMASAIVDPDPVIVLECETLYDVTGDVPENDDWMVPIGKARIAREGTHLTIVTYGNSVAVALEAAQMLAESDGIEAEVIDLRSLRPLDVAAIVASVRKTGRLLTLDDATPLCSISSEVCATVAATSFSALKAAPVRMEAADTPVAFAANLEALTYADAGEVTVRARRLAVAGKV